MTSTDPVLVLLADTLDGSPDPAAAELIGAASTLGTPVVLATSAAHAEALGALGAAKVAVSELSLIDAALAAAETFNPAAILTSHDVRGRDLAARVAVRLGRAVLTDAVGVRRDEQGIVTDHSNYGGAFTAVAAATHSAPVITLRLGSVEARAEAAAGEVVEVSGEAHERRLAEVLESVKDERTSTRPELTTADKVVAGGVALGDADMFEELVGGLADALGAAVGATRSAVDEDQVPYEAQIGQTGVLVSPKLYIGIGISGAGQHLVGMQTADAIVAINNDEDAPIFEVADFGIIGDLFDVVPDIIDELESRK